ncbi:MAG: 2-C-methyl-D-erythritol 2,4-cyclodiphosphate synthase [Candidatus Zhuqueibacterota bacterium]
MRIGFGYDVHRLVCDRKLILGGIGIPYEKGLLGHSDADVLSHAIGDALLGAAALRDIGHHFPPSEQKFKDISSLVILKEITALLRQAGFEIVNVDSTIVAENPKMKPYIDAMVSALGEVLGIEMSQVSVKATTTEGLGFTGIGEGIAAYAVAVVMKR